MTRGADMVAGCFAGRDYIEGRKVIMEMRKPVLAGS